ncbi:hypothetical protein AKO1_002565 [Acrasis kona]|uniref:Uncharacterized protein n=1 Tax=Acrasis kona TaxID=1008807 RepID=A0AAW2ZNY7_9EUKA
MRMTYDVGLRLHVDEHRDAVLMNEVTSNSSQSTHRHLEMDGILYEARDASKSNVYNDSFAQTTDEWDVMIQQFLYDKTTGAAYAMVDTVSKKSGKFSLTRKIPISLIRNQCVGLNMGDDRWCLVPMMTTHKYML